MIRSVIRFFIVLAVAVVIGVTLYVAMQAIQPLANHLDPEPAEVRPVGQQNFEGPRSFYIPDLRDLARGSVSMGKDVFVFAVLTVVVVGLQRRIPRARRPALEPEEANDTK